MKKIALLGGSPYPDCFVTLLPNPDLASTTEYRNRRAIADPDGGMILIDQIRPQYQSYNSVGITKVDATGAKVYNFRAYQTRSGTNYDNFSDVSTVLFDAAGNAHVIFYAYPGSYCVVKISPAGVVAWTKTIGTNGVMYPTDFMSDKAGNFYIAGGLNSYDSMLIKFTPDLVKTWEWCWTAYTGTDAQVYDKIAGIALSVDESYIFCSGSFMTYAGGPTSVFVGKVNASTGAPIGNLIYQTGASAASSSIARDPASDFFYALYSMTAGGQELVKYDSNMAIVWTKKMPTAFHSVTCDKYGVVYLRTYDTILRLTSAGAVIDYTSITFSPAVGAVGYEAGDPNHLQFDPNGAMMLPTASSYFVKMAPDGAIYGTFGPLTIAALALPTLAAGALVAGGTRSSAFTASPSNWSIRTTDVATASYARTVTTTPIPS